MIFRRSFTILEIIVAIGLLGIMGFFGTRSLQSLLDKYRFLATTENCYELFRELQLKALTLESDIQVCLHKDQYWEIEVHSPETFILIRKVVMKNIENVFIDGVKKKDQKFTIFSTGRIEPGVAMKLVGKNKTCVIDFRKPILIKYGGVDGD